MKTAAVCVVKNAEFRIAEWIAYQIAIGFDTVILLDNQSTDATVAVIKAFMPFHDVRLIDWPMTGVSYQKAGYEYAVWSNRREFDWCACIDADEFILPPASETIADILNRAGAKAAVAMPWAVFGSNGWIERPPGLVIDCYTTRAPDNFFVNRHVKSIVRPDAMVKCLSPHLFEMIGDYADPSGRTIDRPADIMDKPISFQFGRINHYFVQSRACWAEKLARGYHDTSRSLDEFSKHDRNDVVDEGARRFSPAVLTILNRVFSGRAFDPIAQPDRAPAF